MVALFLSSSTSGTKTATLPPTSTSNCHVMALSMFFGSMLCLVPALCVNDHHPEWSGYNCTGNVGKGTVLHHLTWTLEDEDDDKLVCCYPTTCNGGAIKFCTEHNGTDICVPCPRNGSCNYRNVTSENLFTMIEFCIETCVWKNAVPEVVFYSSSVTKKAGDNVTLQPTIHSDYELKGFIWSFVNTTGSYDIASSLTEISNRRKYKVGPLQNPYLSIINIEPQDHGTYQLIVGNPIGPSNVTDVVLNVTAKPIVSMAKASDNVDAGTTYVISCTIIGNQEAIKSTFLFENIHGKVTEISSNVSSNGLMTHTIHNTSSSDSGKYTCQSENSEGRTESTLHLTVNSPPEMYSPFAGRVMEYMIGDNVSISLWVSQTPIVKDLSCKIKDSPSKQMFPSMPYNVSNVGMSFNYTIKNVQQNYNGIYVCNATNRLGSSNFSVEINVIFQKTTTAPLVTPKEQNCEWLHYLTTSLASIVLAFGCIAPIRPLRCHRELSDDGKRTLLIMPGVLIIIAIGVLVPINLVKKDCTIDTIVMVVIFSVVLLFALLFGIYLCKNPDFFRIKKDSNQQDEQMELQSLR